ncbi:BppU family phage baseplate upper protein [Enterococcus faecium]|uniref:BppU family phage baseplate upper protein n=1 Tax=Enterococcus faecium TaxID=1352 RepID=UPI0034E96129
MASSLYNLALDFSKELNYTKAIMARQGDKGITVTVKPYLNGLQMDTSGGTFTLKGTTPSNRYVDSVATSVTSEEVTFSLDGTFMSEAGYYKHCYVEYRKDNQILTTQDIIFFSLGVSDISQGQADEYVSQLEELIRKYNETFDAFMAETKGRVDSLNQQITDLTGQAKTLQDKLDALKEEISKLGNLQVMYSNSIDFGGYDYSGNPNLLSKLSYDLIENQNTSAGTLSKGENSFKYNKISAETEGGVELYYKRRGIANWLPSNKTLVMTVKLRAGADYSPVDGKLILIRYRYVDSGTGKIVLGLPINSNSITQEWKEFSITGTTPTFSPQAYHPWIQFRAQDGILGEIEMSYDIKIEEGSTATPFQPNLLAEPYNMCREYPNENIADPKVKFPIESGDHQIYQGYTEEELMIGQTYTITLKGTKPASQTFVAYNHWTARLGELKPVDGLTDVWSLTFTPTNVVAMPKLFRVYQYPRSTVGACQIDWLKIEKGNTRTPNISEYKYRGTGMRDSNNPKDYVWDLAPEYVEDNLATDIKISEITGKANNYTDGKVSKINSQLTASINEVDTTAKDAQTKANANETAIKSMNSRVNEIENIITALTKEETYLLPASIVSGGSLKFTSRGGMTVATGSFKLAKDIAFGEVLVNDLPDSMINIDNNAIGTGAVTGNSVSQIYVESNTRKVVANTAMKKDQWFTVGFSYHSKLSI